MLTVDQDQRITAKEALKHQWFLNALESDGTIFMSNSEYDKIKDAMHHSKNPLPSQTPVMAGYKDPNAPPETPFLRDAANNKESTPVINRHLGNNKFFPQQQQ